MLRRKLHVYFCSIFLLIFALVVLCSCEGGATLSDEIESWADQIRAAKWGAATKLGTPGNPVKMFFTPSAEADKVILSGEVIAKVLEEKTGLKFLIRVPTSYAVLIQALGTDAADIAWIAPFAYVRAHELNGAVPILKTVRHGETFYRGQILVRADSRIKKLGDLQNCRIGFTDAASTAGHIFPKALLGRHGITPREQVFLGGHPQAVIAVYDGKVDAACTYYSPPVNGEIKDARGKVLTTYPDVAEKVVILQLTDPIPNDLVAVRHNLPPDIVMAVKDALLEFAGTSAGQKVLMDLYNFSGLVPADDQDYEVIRETLRLLPELAKQLMG